MEEVFDRQYTTGDMVAISTIAGIIGKIAVFIISIVGFGIIMASILKNSMHGLYAVAPKFWDRVDEVKKAGIRSGEAAGKIAGGNNEVMKLLGSGMSVVLSILPNVKAMTDFDGEMLDAKAYFMKAIPLMCVQIFIGVFIFFGYPSQVAQKFSEFGTGMFDVVLTNMDPKEWVQSVPDKLAILKFATDGSMDEVDKHINTISKKVASTYISAANDMTKEARLRVALDLEQWVESTSSEWSAYADSDKYNMDVTATVYKSGGDPGEQVARVNGKSGNGSYTFAYYNTYGAASNNSGIPESVMGEWYIRFDVKFSDKASKNVSTTLTNVNKTIMSVPNNQWVRSDDEIKIEIGSQNVGSYGLSASNNTCTGKAEVDGTEVNVSISVINNSLTVKRSSGATSIKDATSISVNGLMYWCGSTGKAAITRIDSNTTGDVSFSSTINGENVSWKWGTYFEDAAEGSKTEDNDNNSSDNELF